MRILNVIIATAILVFAPLGWGILMGFGTDIVKRAIGKNRNESHG